MHSRCEMDEYVRMGIGACCHVQDVNNSWPSRPSNRCLAHALRYEGFEVCYAVSDGLTPDLDIAGANALRTPVGQRAWADAKKPRCLPVLEQISVRNLDHNTLQF